MESIGDRLKRAVRDRGFSVRSFAAASGIPYPSLKDYVADKSKPGSDPLLKIRTHLGVNLDWLLTGDGEAFMPTFRSPKRHATIKDVLELVHRFDNVSELAGALSVMRSRHPTAPLVSPAISELLALIDSLPHVQMLRAPLSLPSFPALSELIDSKETMAQTATHVQKLIDGMDSGKELFHPDYGDRPLTCAELDNMVVAELMRVRLSKER